VQVETLGDNVYMVAGGVPDRRANHVESMSAVALEFRTKVRQINVPDIEQILIRIGNLLTSSSAAHAPFFAPFLSLTPTLRAMRIPISLRT